MSNPAFELLSYRILLPYIPVALTALVTVLHHSALKQRLGDTRGMWLYFVLFFFLVLVVPVGIVLVVESRPLSVLAGFGIRLGDARIGLLILLAGLPVAVLVGYVGSIRSEVRDWYPYSKQVCTRKTDMIFYEAGYILFYYTAWEFLYRGLLFFPLLQSLGLLPAVAITTILSTFHHIGYPKSEILAALVGGALFAGIAFFTRSMLYPFAIHAVVGVSLDIFICSRRNRQGSHR